MKMESLATVEYHNPGLEDMCRAIIDETYSHVPNTNIGLVEQNPRDGIYLSRLLIETGSSSTQQLFVLGTLHSGTPNELSLVQAACQSMFISPSRPLNSPTLIVEERVRNPNTLATDETIFREEGEAAVIEKQFRSAGHERVTSFALSPERWAALASAYGDIRTAKYLQWRLGPQWSTMSDSERPPLVRYFQQGLDRYPTIIGDLPDAFTIHTIRSLLELGVGIINEEGVTDLRRFANWMRRETFAPYALRERKGLITPMQYFSIIVNRERDVALLHTAVQELQNGRDVVIGTGDLHGAVVLNVLEKTQSVLGWQIDKQDIPLAA